MEQQREMETTYGTVSAIVFHNPENGYSVLRLTASDGEEITAVGCVPNVGLGEELNCVGQWITHATYGEQFIIESFERELPVDERGIADYLGSGLIRGVGPKLAARIARQILDGQEVKLP